MRKLALIFGVTFVIFNSTKVVIAENQLTREELLEEALIVRYSTQMLEVTGKLFMCEKITDIRRLNGNRHHRLTIELVTFEKAHMPPYDLVRLTIIDQSDQIVITNIERKKNLSIAELDEFCYR
ncbi:DUF3888 domain-containing protein [Gracilibacillus kekensis]|nr:DUF3888 domain-containing protein [Gracilibacillus kekensis]